MISISREGTQVCVVVDPKIDQNTLWLRWDCKDEWYAMLLSQRLIDKLGDTMEEIRRQAYNKGWKDAKSKKCSKDKWFARFAGVMK